MLQRLPGRDFKPYGFSTPMLSPAKHRATIPTAVPLAALRVAVLGVLVGLGGIRRFVAATQFHAGAHEASAIPEARIHRSHEG